MSSQNDNHPGVTKGEIKSRNGHVLWQRDDVQEVMIYRYYGEVMDQFFQEEMTTFWTGLPEISHYNSLTDFREAEMRISWPVIQKMAEDLQPSLKERGLALKSAFLVPVDHYDQVIKVLSVYFDEITFKVFMAEEQAMAWLTEKAG